VKNMADDLDEMGPIDYLVVEFPGNRMTGEAFPLLVDLVVAQAASSSPAIGFPSRPCSPHWTPSNRTADTSPTPEVRTREE
jgi:hypothetical protein